MPNFLFPILNTEIKYPNLDNKTCWGGVRKYSSPDVLLGSRNLSNQAGGNSLAEEKFSFDRIWPKTNWFDVKKENEMFSNRYVTLAAVVGTLAAVLLAVYAYANSSTVVTSEIGVGDTAIASINVTNVVYTQATDPTKLLNWVLTLSTSATTVKSRVGTGGTAVAWVDCAGATVTWTCTATNGTLLLDATSLQVSAVASGTP